MNDAANDDTYKPTHYPSADEAFGSALNDDLSGPEDDIPF
jgi:replicative DNA helicase